MLGVFLSHSSADNGIARSLATDLRRRGIRCWLDEAEIKVGDSLLDRISQGIAESEYLAVILSPHSVRSEWVKREVEIALHMEIETRRLKALPILLADCELPAFLMGKAYADFRTDYKRGLATLLNTLLPKRRFRELERRTASAAEPLVAITFKRDDKPVLRRRVPVLSKIGALRRKGPTPNEDQWIQIDFDGIEYLDKVELMFWQNDAALIIDVNLDHLASGDDNESVWRDTVDQIEKEIWEHDRELMSVFECNEIAVYWGGPDSSDFAQSVLEITYYVDSECGYAIIERRWPNSAVVDKRTLRELSEIAKRFCGIVREITIALGKTDADKQ